MHGERADAMGVTTFLVEGYWPDTGTEAFQAGAARLDERLARMRSAGVAIGTVAATLVPGDQAAYWLITGPSVDVVARACAQAGLRVERIVDAVEVRAGIPSDLNETGRDPR